MTAVNLCDNQAYNWTVTANYNPTSNSMAGHVDVQGSPGSTANCSPATSMTMNWYRQSAGEFSGSYSVSYKNGTTHNFTGATLGRQVTETPTGDSITWQGFAGNIGYPTEGQYLQTLQSAHNVHYAGLQVQEQPGTGSGTCYQQVSNSAVAEITTTNGSSWNVQDDNTWGYDVIGFPPSAVTYYQKHLPPGVSCTVSVQTQMQIQSASGSSGWVPYGSPLTLTFSVTPSGTGVKRGSDQLRSAAYAP